MRVLHATDHLRNGGGERLLASLLGGLAADGRVRSFVVVASARGADPGLVTEVRRHAEHLEVLDTRALYDPRLVRAVARSLRRHRPHVVHAHPGNANLASRVVALAAGTPHVVTLHTAPGKLIEETRLRAAVDGWGAWMSARLVAPTRRLAADYRHAYRLPKSRFEVIANAVPSPPALCALDVAAARATLTGARARELGHPARGEGPVVLSIARLQPAKGLADLVDALAALRQRVPRARLAIAGDGPDRGRLADLICRRGLQEAVTLLGHRNDVGALLAAADVFCLPSLHEGLPLALLEAMGAGLPSVTTAVGGIPDVVKDGVTGLLVNPSSPADLATALARVLEDPATARAMGARARALVVRDHSIDAAARSYADLYEAVAGVGAR